ncbi:glycosyltransferase family 39 protein [Candidatus Saganbacteria bacterium]|nr:glycosyltransferase family 39 protein [Candidatus Saganbacteria bacterium]
MLKKLNWAFVIVLVISAVIYFFQLGASSIWDQDEGQMAAASFEMVKSGDYLTPHLNSAVYFHKPPLYAWLTTIAFRIFGFTEFAVRFWAAIFGILGVYLTYAFAKTLFNERAGLLSAIIIATSPLYIVLSKMGLVDMVLCFFVTMALLFFYKGYQAPAEKKWFYLMWLAMGMATMTKGPLGILVPLASIIIYLAIDKKFSFLKELAIVKGLLLYLLVASPWFIIETIRHGSYFLKIIFGQFLFTIYMSPLQQHPGPVYYYIIVALVGFLPWSGFFFVSLFKKPHALLLSLFLVMLALFSTASTKVPGYFLPAFPAMAIMTGSCLDKIFSKEDKLSFYSAVIFPILILATTIYMNMRIPVPPQYTQAVIYLQILLLITLAGFFLSFLFSFFKPQPNWTIAGFAISIVILFIGIIVWLMPYAEDHKPTPTLALALRGKMHIAFYRTWLPPSLVFYLNRQSYPTVSLDIQDEKELRKFLSQKGSAAYVPEDEVKKLKFAYVALKTKAQYVIITSPPISH